MLCHYYTENTKDWTTWGYPLRKGGSKLLKKYKTEQREDPSRKGGSELRKKCKTEKRGHPQRKGWV